MSLTTVAFAVGAGAAALALFGPIPALALRRVEIARALRAERGTTVGRRRAMQGLVVLEIAASTALLSGALLIVESLSKQVDEGPGFDPVGLYRFDLGLVDPDGLGGERWQDLLRRLEARLPQAPGVVAAGRSSAPPLSGTVLNRNLGPTPEAVERRAHRADLVTVSHGFFETMGMSFVAGRNFLPGDDESRPLPVVIDRVTAEDFWPGQDPLGRPILHDVLPDEGGVVVGVVERVLARDIGQEARPTVYHPDRGIGVAWTFLVRSDPDADIAVASIREVVAELAPGLLPYAIRDMEERVRVSYAPLRFLLLTMGAFAAIATVIAAGGLFGVVAYTVRAQTSELGVRMALGADRAAIRWMVLRRALLLAALGIALGVGTTIALSKVIAGVSYNLEPVDPQLLIVTALLLGLISVAACAAPARWAERVDPVRVLGG